MSITAQYPRATGEAKSIGKTPSEICLRMALMHRGITVSGLAKRLGVSQPFISMLISGKRGSLRIENAICKLLCMPREALWNDQPR